MFKLFKRKKKQAPEPILISSFADIVALDGDYYLVETRCHAEDSYITEIFDCDRNGNTFGSTSLHSESCTNEETAKTRHKYIMRNLGRTLFDNWDGDAEFRNGCLELLARIKELQSEHKGIKRNLYNTILN